jgi:hypothetical protein
LIGKINEKQQKRGGQLHKHWGDKIFRALVEPVIAEVCVNSIEKQVIDWSFIKSSIYQKDCQSCIKEGQEEYSNLNSRNFDCFVRIGYPSNSIASKGLKRKVSYKYKDEHEVFQ